MSQHEPPALPARDEALVARILSELRDVTRLTAAWTALDASMMEEGDLVQVEVGSPDPERLRALAADYAARTGAPLPPLYVALWSKVDGVDIRALPPDESEGYVVRDPLESEPVLWPANDYGEHWLFEDAGALDEGHPFVLGELVDSGHLLLLTADGEVDPPVVWLGRREAPFELAPSLASFLQAWADAAFRFQIVLRRAGVPGWGGASAE
jgi:hypothetical protein